MKYSIITPVFNREDCVARCLNSVIRNLSPEIELEHIVVDDGSSDGTAAICEKYAAEHNHIRFIRFERNRGTNAARNAAISSAKGEFCIILDSDDYFADNAILTIHKTVSANDYRHYCFAADDMVPQYDANQLLAGKDTIVLSFEDFLLERLSGDFIHVISTETLRKYPFDESLRIYEGVFFKRFYREAGEILFTKSIVTFRERGRSDSVTREVIVRNKDAAKKLLKSKELLVEWFEHDFCKTKEGKTRLDETYSEMVRLNLMLGNYKEVSALRKRPGICRRTGMLMGIVFRFRLGWMYLFAAKLYFAIKY